MRSLPFELLLALRYLRPKRTHVSIITMICIVGVMLGVAVLIVVMSVMSGFDVQLRDRILGFNAHLKVFHPGVTMRDYPELMRRVGTNAGVKGVAPFILAPVLVQNQPQDGTGSQVLAPYVRGIDAALESKVSNLPQRLEQGRFDVSDKGVLIGTVFAAELHLQVGDTLLVHAPRNLKAMHESLKTKKEVDVLIPPDEFVVRGIFDVGHYEYNASIMICSLEDAQDLYDIPNQAHGLLVMLDDPEQADRMRERLLDALGNWALAADDFRALPAFAVRLREKKDAVSAYIHGALNPETRQSLAAYPGDGPLSGALELQLLRELNQLVAGRSIDDPQRFARVTLRGETQRLRARHAPGATPAHLNRLLLEDAFPLDISRNSRLAIRTWAEENSSILTALQVEKNVMFYILFFIMVVAAFGIASALITFVVQKTREIGMLKALGATSGQVMWLFLSQSAIVGVLGVLSGLGLGMLAVTYRNEFLHFMNRLTGKDLFPPAIYIFDQLPALIVSRDIAMICGGSLIICILAGLIPAWSAGRLKPVEALRHE